MLEIAVITISDRAFRGEYRDISGPTIVEILSDAFPDSNVTLTIVSDDKIQIRKAIQDNLGKDYVITNGGTGISPRDYTPEVTREICEIELPGISEMLRRESYKETPNSVFSRGIAGIRNETIIINFPGSVKAASFCANLIVPILEHGKKMLLGGGHEK
jgi:molybdopterin adenylyltransferase